MDVLVEMQAQIQALRAGLDQIRSREVVARSGTAFPASYPSNTPFFRSDLGWWCYYDGTRWLTAHEYQMAAGITTYAATNNTGLDHTFRGDFSPFITRVAVVTSVATTNNGTNFWTISIQGVNLAKSAATDIYVYTTAAHSVGVLTQVDVGAGTLTNQVLANRQYWRTAAGTTGAPGTITLHSSIFYRLIVT